MVASLLEADEADLAARALGGEAGDLDVPLPKLVDIADGVAELDPAARPEAAGLDLRREFGAADVVNGDDGSVQSDRSVARGRPSGPRPSSHKSTLSATTSIPSAVS